MTPNEIIQRAYALYVGPSTDDGDLTREQRNVAMAMLAWGNFCLQTREYADDGDEDARMFLDEITETRLRSRSSPAESEGKPE